jgi:hypothetical protein
LQTALLAERADTLRLPTRVRYLRIDPAKHLSSVEERGNNFFIIISFNIEFKMAFKWLNCAMTSQLMDVLPEEWNVAT